MTARCPVLLLALLLLCAVCVAGARHRHHPPHSKAVNAKPRLQFHDGRFRIAQFADTHYGMNNSAATDQQTLSITRLLLENEKPDLVVFTGDTIMNTGHNCTEQFFVDTWTMLTQPLLDAGVPWAWVSGNHDDEYCSEFRRPWIAQMDMQFPLSLTSYTPGITGVNYVVPIASEHNASETATNLWMLDSASYDCFGITGYGCVQEDQIEWYEATARAAFAKNGGAVIPALAFMHIPIQEYLDMWNQENVTGAFWTDGVSCQSVNTGVYAAYKRVGDVRLMTVGHDHNNDFGGVYNGITLHYGRKTGYACYGPPAGFNSGSRIFEVTESPFAIHTWVREDTGERVEPASVRTPADGLQAKCGGYG